MDDDFDLEPHQATWAVFCKLMTYSLAGVLVILALMAALLT